MNLRNRLIRWLLGPQPTAVQPHSDADLSALLDRVTLRAAEGGQAAPLSCDDAVRIIVALRETMTTDSRQSAEIQRDPDPSLATLARQSAERAFCLSLWWRIFDDDGPRAGANLEAVVEAFAKQKATGYEVPVLSGSLTDLLGRKIGYALLDRKIGHVIELIARHQLRGSRPVHALYARVSAVVPPGYCLIGAIGKNKLMEVLVVPDGSGPR